ncbi:MAG: Crp/Fnr family transcriptional regulator [Pseudomonadota bacterium]
MHNELKANAQLGSCDQCPIRHRAVCSKCEPDELARLDAIKYYRTFEAGQVVVWAGESLDFVASIVDGVATISQTLEDGRRQMVGILLPSDFVGRPTREIAPYDVTAATELTLCCFRRTPFRQLLQDVPHVSHRLLEMTIDDLDAAREWMTVLGRKTAREKIASLFAIMARRASPQKAEAAEFDLPLTREAMADYLGLTLETVSRQVSALRKEGVISLIGKRRVSVADLPALLAETGDEGAFLYS